VRSPVLLPLLAALALAPTAGRGVATDPVTATDSLLARWDRPDAPGFALGIVRDGRLVHARGYGLANLEFGVPVTPRTPFHVASVSKQFTAFAVQLLAAEGKLSVEDEVRRWVPELHDFGPRIAIRHLLHHTSGIRDQWTLLTLAGWRMEDVITQDDIFRLVFRQRELNFEPGTEYLYSNSGYSLLGLIVERVSGRTLREFLDERVFRPLEMRDTHVHDDHRMLVPGRAYSYAQAGNGYRHSVLSYANSGATSLFTTVEDLARWDANLETGRVGGPAVLRAMLDTVPLTSGQRNGYASGLIHGRYRGLATVEHGGSDAGFRSVFLRFPSERFTVILLGNLASLNPGQVARQVANVWLADAFPEPAPPAGPPQAGGAGGGGAGGLPALSATVPAAASYAGRYWSEELATMYEVVARGDTLVVRHPRTELILRPRPDGSFGAGPPLGTVRFERDGDGAAARLFVDTGRARAVRFERADG
jgi:CubicO group peptidase (beta-lactamase class C family)